MNLQNTADFKGKSTGYFTEGYSCSESVIKAAYECGIIDHESDLDLLINIASPFSGGKNACICGALAGAQMIVGCLISRKDIDYSSEQLKTVSAKIVDKFKGKGHVTCCRAYLDGYNETPEEKYNNCIETIKDVADILYESILKDIDNKTLV